MRMQRVVYNAQWSIAQSGANLFLASLQTLSHPLGRAFLTLSPPLLSLPEENEATFLPFPARASARQALLAGRRIS